MSTASEKVSSILLSTSTLAALSAGFDELRVGETTSAVVKESDVSSSIPEKELLEGSSKAVESIST